MVFFPLLRMVQRRNIRRRDLKRGAISLPRQREQHTRHGASLNDLVRRPTTNNPSKPTTLALCGLLDSSLPQRQPCRVFVKGWSVVKEKNAARLRTKNIRYQQEWSENGWKRMESFERISPSKTSAMPQAHTRGFGFNDTPSKKFKSNHLIAQGFLTRSFVRSLFLTYTRD